MAGTTPTDPAAARIIKHMNADHQDSLVRYLEFYQKVPSWTARHAQLMSITLSSMIISVSPNSTPAKGTLSSTNLPLSTTYTIPFDPPLSSFAESRDRVVKMDKHCIAALGRSSITLKHYIPPQPGLDIFITVTVFCTFVLLHRRANLSVDTAPQFLKPLWTKYPSVSEFLYWVQPRVLGPMLVIHLGETWWMDRTRLRKYSVPRGGRVWWLWMLGTFLGGFTNFIKLDKWVSEEKKRRETSKH